MGIKAVKFVFLLKISVIVWLMHNISLNDAVIMKFTNYKCENIDLKIVEIHQCRLKAIKRDVVTLNFNSTLLEPAYSIRLEAQLFKKANGYKPWLYKIDIELCRFVRKAYNPIAIVLLGDVLQYSSFNHSCPYKGLMSVQGWFLKPEAYRLIPFPTGDYLVDTKWYINKKFAIIGKFYFTVVEDL